MSDVDDASTEELEAAATIYDRVKLEMKEKEQKWDARFLKLAIEISTWSKDRSRQVGCIIATADRQIVGTGYNGFPRGVNDDAEERHQRPDKYMWTEHAERNAIFQAARYGVALKDTIIYVPWYPCADCARGIVQAGIRFMVAIEPDWNDPKYAKDFAVAKQLLLEGGVEVKFAEGFQPPKQVTA